jgi:hypothetical protein
VLLYRRSVLSLLPSLAQQVTVGVFTFLIAMAKAIGVVDLEKEVKHALGQTDASMTDKDVAESVAGEEAPTVVQPQENDQEHGDSLEEANLDDVMVGNDIAALHPALSGPAVQILPLAVCA